MKNQGIAPTPAGNIDSYGFLISAYQRLSAVPLRCFCLFFFAFLCFLLPPQALAKEAQDRKHTLLIAWGDKFDDSAIVVEEGVGFNEIVVGDPRCNQKFIKRKLGKPNYETDQWLNYNAQYGFDFWMEDPKSPVSEIRLNHGFKGKLSSGITPNSTMSDVFKAYGQPATEQIVADLGPHFDNRVLYRRGQGNTAFNMSKIFYEEYGLLIWFSGDRIQQIVVFKKKPKASPERTKDIVVEEGVGFNDIVIADPKLTREMLKSKFGPPDGESRRWLNYSAQYGFDFWMPHGESPIMAIRFDEGFGGKLKSGISLSSTREDAFRVYGEPIEEKNVEEFPPADLAEEGVLYKNGELSRIRYWEKGVSFQFLRDGITKMQVFQTKAAYEKSPPTPEMMQRAMAEYAKTAVRRKLERSWPDILTGRLWGYAKEIWTYWYLFIPIILLLGLWLKNKMLGPFYRWRPLPEGKLLVVEDPTDAKTASIDIGLGVRQLKKRRLLIGSGAEADIRLRHKSIDYLHACISARKADGQVVTYIEQMGDGQVIVNGARGGAMSLGHDADVQIGEFRFKYEKPTENA